MITQACLPWKSFWSLMQGGGIQGETGRTPGIEEIEVRVWLDKNNAEIELLKERILEICRGSQLIIHLSANWHMHVRKLSRSS